MIWRAPNFRSLFGTRFFVSLAQQMQGVAVGWQIYAIKHDPLYLGLIGLAEALPAIGIALYAGHVVDRSHPLKVYSRATLTLFIGTLFLLLTAIPSLGFSDDLRVAVIFFVIFLTGVARGFTSPAHFTMTAQSLNTEQLKQSTPYMTGAWQTATIAGPALGGVLYAALGVSFTYLVVAVLGFVSYAFCWSIALPERAPRDSSQAALSMWQSVGEGLRFVFNDRLLLAALSLDMFAVFFGGATSILPMYVDQILRAGPSALGALRAAPSVGSILSTLWFLRHPPLVKAGRKYLLAVAGFGICMILFGLARTFSFAFVVLLLSGILDNVSVNVRWTLLQLTAPPEMRGRISAVNSIFLGSSNELGEFESGLAARLLGLVPSIIFGGAATLLVVIVIAYWSKPLRELDLSKA